MENWFAPDFDAKKAGWKSGAAPFGVAKRIRSAVSRNAYGPSKRTLPNTVSDNDVLLMRETFDLPPLKEGHRYRIRVDGSVHANSGEGYAIYVNGKLLAESKNGITAWRREGWRPRGSHVWAGFPRRIQGRQGDHRGQQLPDEQLDSRRLHPRLRDPSSVWLEEHETPAGGTVRRHEP